MPLSARRASLRDAAAEDHSLQFSIPQRYTTGMPQCPFCEHENPSREDRCANCGASLTSIAAERGDGNPYTAPQTVSTAEESIHELLAAGRKIEAIKLY